MSKQLLRLVAFCSVVCASPLIAQQAQNAPHHPGRIVGTVVAESGPLVAAEVTARNVADTTVVASTATAGDGRFLLDALPLGTYRLRVTFLGYKLRELPNVALTTATPVAELGAIKMDRLLIAYLRGVAAK